MKKISFFFISLLIFSGFFLVARAGLTLEESIQIFNSKIIVNKDNSVDVVESITYNTGTTMRHGIFRDIYPYSSTGMPMEIGGVTVMDENNNPYIFLVTDFGQNVRIRVGDPNKTFTGIQTYVIKYHATNAAAQYKDFDEIYWNVTGNEWKIPIYHTEATVVLPDGVEATQATCYYGTKGSKNQCTSTEKDDSNGTYNFKPLVSLGMQEGVTVAVGFSKGIVTPYSASTKIDNFSNKYLIFALGGILPLLTLICSLFYWHKKGRDPKGRGVIVPQYDVSDDLTPLEVAGIVNQKIKSSDISAEIIYLATKGYLKINQIEEKTLGIFKSTNYQIVKSKDDTSLLKEFDQRLLKGLFRSQSNVVEVSKLKRVFYKDLAVIKNSAMNTLLREEYYVNLGKWKIFSQKKSRIIRTILSIFLYIIARILLSSGIIDGYTAAIFLSILLSVVIYKVVSLFFPAKTEKGVATKEYLLGLKDYLMIAEKDRLLFHNAPDKKPEVFEKLLPYAMVLGVANIWAKEFEGIYSTPPSWYSGAGNAGFSAIAFTHSMSGFSSYTSSSLSSSPGGSGGGGSSGGGGGGGGGGGW